MNINTDPMINCKTTAKDYKHLLMTYDCNNLINKYTRKATDINGQTTKSVIDHIITNIDVNQINSGVLHYHVSDHLPIFGLFNLKVERQRHHPQLEKRMYNKAGKCKFIRLMKDS